MGIYDTKKEAVQEWVRGFNAIPQAIIEKAYGSSIFDEFREITPITKYQCDACGHSFNRKEYDSEVGCPKCNGEVYAVEPNDFLPMWGTMWTFEVGIDEEWVRNNLEIVANCGFRIYESNELGIVIGIDGAGYDFYENHWIPLYDARGLRWHSQSQGMNKQEYIQMLEFERQYFQMLENERQYSEKQVSQYIQTLQNILNCIEVNVRSGKPKDDEGLQD